MLTQAEIFAIAASFLTSTLSGIVGFGGGIILLAVLSQFFPPLLLIPFHGMAQLASNVSRAYLFRQHISWPTVASFGGGAAFAAFIGSFFIIEIPKSLFQIILGIFILLISFWPKKSFGKKTPYKWPIIGAFTTFVGLFLGAVGALVAAFYLTEDFKKEEILSTQACNQALSHGFKVLAYFISGFAIVQHTYFLIGLIIAVSLGSLMGKLFVGKVSERMFRNLVRSVIFLLALRLIFMGIKSL